MNNYHLKRRKNLLGWELTPEKSDESVLFAITKQTLIDKLEAFFKKRNEKASVKIHNMMGTIQEERTYPRSADPHRSKG